MKELEKNELMEIEGGNVLKLVTYLAKLLRDAAVMEVLEEVGEEYMKAYEKYGTGDIMVAHG